MNKRVGVGMEGVSSYGEGGAMRIGRKVYGEEGEIELKKREGGGR